jgi:hypothetical protein
MSVIVGTAGNDSVAGTAEADLFRLYQAGTDVAAGRGGNDRFVMRDAFDALDSIRGGTGFDTLSLNGDYSAGLVFGAATMRGIEKLTLDGDFVYDLTMNDANVAAGQRLLVDSTHSGLIFDGSAETDGSFVFHLGLPEQDHVIGGAGDDFFRSRQSFGSGDIMEGRGGNDTFKVGPYFSNFMTIDGGDGDDTVIISGTFPEETMLNFTGVERVVVVGSDASTRFSSEDASVAAGKQLIVDARGEDVGPFVFNGSAETDGSFVFYGTWEGDHVVGGAGDDVFKMGQGLTAGDVMEGGAGNDTFRMGKYFNETSTIDGGDGFDTLLVSGTLSGDVDIYDTVGVESIVVVGRNDVDLGVADSMVAAGDTLVVDGSAARGRFSISAYDEADGHLNITSGRNWGTLQGGTLNDIIVMSRHHGDYSIWGSGGADDIRLNRGEDEVGYFNAAESTGFAGHDRVQDFDADKDSFWFGPDLDVSGFSDTPVSASVSAASLDADLHGAAGGDANGAWVVQTSGGDLSGHVYLCVDLDGDAAYTAGDDIVIDITGYTGTLDTGAFDFN